MRRWWRTTSSPVTSSVSCSCFARVTITVRAVHVWNRCIKTIWCLCLCQHEHCFAADFQNYLRTQVGSTTTINIIICTVDYLLRLQVKLTIQPEDQNKRCKKLSINGRDTVLSFLSIQESISDFYWYYSGKDVIDDPGKKNFSKAMTVAKQIFNSLTEYIQVKYEKKKKFSSSWFLTV